MSGFSHCALPYYAHYSLPSPTEAGSAAQTLAQDAEAVPLLPPTERTRLKGQSFVRPERIKEVLESVQSVLMQRVPDLKAVMKVNGGCLCGSVVFAASWM